MEGIILQNVDREKFIELFNKVDELSNNIQLLVNKKLNEKVSPEVAAEEIGVTNQTIYAYIKSGKLRASKVGRKLLINRSDLNEALKEVKSLKYKR